MDDPNQKGFYIFMGILVGICLLGTLYFLPAYLSLTRAYKNTTIKWTVNLTQSTASAKTERCFCISSGHRDQKGPAHFPASSTEALLDVSPVAAPPIAQPGQPVKGKAAAARRCSAPLTGCPGCATSQGATGDISSRAAPFPWIGKGRGDRVEPLSSQTTVFPRLIC